MITEIKSFEDVQNPFMVNPEVNTKKTRSYIYNEKAKKNKLKKEKISKKKSVTDFIFTFILFAIVVGFFFFVFQGDKTTVFGYSIKSVTTGSMQSEIPQGSLVLIKEINPAFIQVGDVITFKKPSAPSETVTHKVMQIERNYDNTGRFGFYTWGIENEIWDKDVVTDEKLIGIVEYHFEGVGDILLYIQKNIWLPFAIAGLIITLILVIQLLMKELKKSKKQKAVAK